MPGTLDQMHFVSLHCIILFRFSLYPFSHVGTSPEDQISVMDLNTIEQIWRRADVSNHGFGCHLFLAPPCCEKVIVVVEVVGVEGVVEEEEVVVVLEEGISGMDLNKGTKVTAVDTDNCTDPTELRPRLNSHPFYQKLSPLLLLTREN